MATDEMTFDANAQAVWNELQRIRNQYGQLEQTLNQATQASQQAANLAVQAAQRQQQATRELARENRQLRTALENNAAGTKQWGQAADTAGKVAKQAFTAVLGTLGVSGVLGTLKSITDQQDQWLRKLHDTLVESDKVDKQLQVQGLLKDEEYIKRRDKALVPIAHEYAISMDEARFTSTSLLNQSLSPDQSMGPIFEEVVAGGRATGSDNLAQFGEGAIKLLRGYGKEITPENVRSLVQDFAAAYKERPVQAGDVLELAKISSLMKANNVPLRDLLAGFVVMKTEGSLSAGEAATGMKNIEGAMAGAKGFPVKKDILEQLGGKGFADQLARHDLSFGQKLGMLSQAIGRAPKDDRSAIFQRLFGKEDEAQAASILSPEGNAAYFRNIELMRKEGPTALRRGLDIRTQGPAADAARQDLALKRAELEQAEKNRQTTERSREIEILETKAGIPPWWRSLTKWGRQLRYGNIHGVDQPTLNLVDQRLAQRSKPAELPDVKATPVADSATAVPPLPPGVGGKKVDFRRADEKAERTAERDRERAQKLEDPFALEVAEARAAASAAALAYQKQQLALKPKAGAQMPLKSKQILDKLEREKDALEIHADAVALEQATLKNALAGSKLSKGDMTGMDPTDVHLNRAKEARDLAAKQREARAAEFAPEGIDPTEKKQLDALERVIGKLDQMIKAIEKEKADDGPVIRTVDPGAHR